MARPTLSEVIDGRLISGDSEIVPTEDEPVRAVDVLEPFAVLYRFSVGERGDWYDQCSVAMRTSDGTWEETSSGGGHGGGWVVPWRPSTQTLDGRAVFVFGSAGMHLPDAQDEMVSVSGIYGFADLAVRRLRVSSEAGDRVVEVSSPVGAFVVLVLGEGAVKLQGLDQSGLDVGQPATVLAV